MSADGKRLDRSFTPDLLPAEDDSSEFSLKYPCGPGQLTGVGFRQSVGLGKHLANAYGELIGRYEAFIRCEDNQDLCISS